jgi:hypothetical protein
LAGNSAGFADNPHIKVICFQDIAAKFPCAGEQGIFLRQAGNKQGIFSRGQGIHGGNRESL